MPEKKHTPEQIIAKLREAEVEIAKAATVPIACRKFGVTEQTRPPLTQGIQRPES